VPGLLHVVAAGLRTDASADALAEATRLASELARADGARTVLVGRDGAHLVTATWLEGRAAMEPFAASPAHMAFIMRGIAPVTSGVWSAAVEISTTAPSGADALWVFGLRTADDVYEWQVRELLTDVEALPGTSACGPTFEERDRLRAAGAVCVGGGAGGSSEELGAALSGLTGRWGEIAASLNTALVPVVAVRGNQR
jgi:hypothetical protein